MSKKVYINIPVKNLSSSMDFLSKLGFSNNPKYTDDKGAAMQFSDDIIFMLLTEEFFKTFTHKEVADATISTEVILGISAESKEDVDELYKIALENGATRAKEKYDYGWMSGVSFYDLDGHLWEVIYTDPNRMPDNS